MIPEWANEMNCAVTVCDKEGIIINAVVTGSFRNGTVEMIFDEDYTARNKSHCYYLMGLGNLGLGNVEKAKDFFAES